MPRRTIEIEGLLRLKVRNPGERNVEYTAELFINRHDKLEIQKLILATGLDAVNLLDIKEKPIPRWKQQNQDSIKL